MAQALTIVIFSTRIVPDWDQLVPEWDDFYGFRATAHVTGTCSWSVRSWENPRIGLCATCVACQRRSAYPAEYVPPHLADADTDDRPARYPGHDAADADAVAGVASIEWHADRVEELVAGDL